MKKYTLAAERLTDIYVSLMLLIFPLFVGLRGYENITEFKFMFFAVLTGVWFSAAIVLQLLSRRRIKLETHHIFACAFAFWAIVSWMASPYRSDSFMGASRYDGLVTQLLYIAIFMGVSVYGKWNKKYVYFLTASALGCGIVALMQIMGSSVLYPGSFTYYDAGVKYVSKFLGTIGNTNLLAAFLCLSLPFSAAAAAFGYKFWPVLLLSSALSGMLLSFTESAGGMVALIAAAAICAPKLAQQNVLAKAMGIAAVISMGVFWGALMAKSQMVEYFAVSVFILCILGAFLFNQVIPPETHRRALAAMMAACVAAGVIAVYFWQGQEGAVFELSQLLHGHMQDEFGSNRIRIWRETLSLVPQRLIFGGGPDTLALRLDVEFTRYFPELGKTLSTYVDNAHNVYLGCLVNMGLPSLLIYIALIGLSLKRIYKNKEEHSVVSGCALICALSENFFGLGLCLVAPVMWVLWGLIYTDDRHDEPGDVIDGYAEEKDNHICNAACDNAAVSAAEQAAGGAQQCCSDSNCSFDRCCEPDREN